MANRPIYIPIINGKYSYVKIVDVEFTWYSGFSLQQKQKTIQELHESAKKLNICKRPLEVSSKSELDLGRELSAFNLKTTTKKTKKEFTVEAAFQSSKVFQDGGPYRDLLFSKSVDAKKDTRLKESGNLLCFNFYGNEWDLEPRTAFYDWLYLNVLFENQSLVEDLCDFDAFTDIEFNPKNSINCQAYSVALYRVLQSMSLLEYAIVSKESFLEVTEKYGLYRRDDDKKVNKQFDFFID